MQRVQVRTCFSTTVKGFSCLQRVGHLLRNLHSGSTKTQAIHTYAKPSCNSSWPQDEVKAMMSIQVQTVPPKVQECETIQVETRSTQCLRQQRRKRIIMEDQEDMADKKHKKTPNAGSQRSGLCQKTGPQMLLKNSPEHSSSF